MNQQYDLFPNDELVQTPPLPNPTEVIEDDDYIVYVYQPYPRFREWFVLVDSHLQDMTGYPITSFHSIPTFDTWADWADDPQEAAFEVLNKDAWGQEFLLGYTDLD
jgi:hypothetical protein